MDEAGRIIQEKRDKELLLAIEEGDNAAVEALLAPLKIIYPGANANATKGNNSYTALQIAVDRGNEDIVRALLEAVADVNGRSIHNSTALHMAAKGGQLNIVDALLEAGADVNAQSNIGSTPLHMATIERRTDIVRALLEAGADVNAKTDRGATALHIAADGYNEPIHNNETLPKDTEEIIKLLLAAGAELKHNGRPAAQAARRSGYQELGDYLENVANGTTPLPTPEEVGLDMKKREAALAAIKPQEKSGGHADRVSDGRTRPKDNTPPL